MRDSWGRHDQPQQAVDRVLAAAEALYERSGFEATTMADVAQQAGCSRATLYNYFPNKRALRTALRNNAAITIAAETSSRVAEIADPILRVTEAMVYSIGRVRETPALAMWFRPEHLSLTNELAQSSDVIAAIAAAFTGDLGSGDHETAPDDPSQALLRARLIVRLIVSFLSAPEPNPADERVMIERLVAPALAGELATPHTVPPQPISTKQTA